MKNIISFAIVVFVAIVVFFLAIVLNGQENAYNRRDDVKDGLSNSLRVLEFEHSEIHEGHHFFLDNYILFASSGDSISFGILTPDTDKQIHLTFGWSVSGITTFEFYESAVYTGGAAANDFNNNRSKSDTSDVFIVQDPTLTDFGTLLSGSAVGASGLLLRLGGASSRENEIILKRNTKYFIVFTSGDASVYLNYSFSWYEHTPLDVGVVF